MSNISFPKKLLTGFLSAAMLASALVFPNNTPVSKLTEYVSISASAANFTTDTIVLGEKKGYEAYSFCGTQSYYSQNRRYRMSLQSDGNLVVYDVAYNRAIWSALKTSAVSKPASIVLALDKHGYLCLTLPGVTRKTFWSNNLYLPNMHPTSLRLSNDGELYVYDETDRMAVWSNRNVLTASGSTVYLESGQCLSSANGFYHAIMQPDGNFVLYAQNPTTGKTTVLWNSGTYNNPGAKLAVQPDGNLVVYSKDGKKALFNSKTAATKRGGAQLQLTDGGALVLVRYSDSKRFINPINGIYAFRPY